MQICSSIYYNQENGYTVAVYETEENIPEGEDRMEKGRNSGQLAVNCPETKGFIYLSKDSGKNQRNMENSIMWHLSKFKCRQRRGVKAYLSSGLVKGIGPVIAERVVRRFGKNTFYVFEECRNSA